jgi:hypothetical protein
MDLKLLYNKFICLKDVHIDVDKYSKEWEQFLEDQLKIKGRGAYGYSKRLFIQKKISELCHTEYNLFKQHIYDLYYKREFGLKSISKELGISYTNVRTMFSVLGIDFHRGRSVVSDRLRSIRKENAIKQNGWRDRRTKNKTTDRGVQGYYFNQSRQKYVWLRSTYEYIFAKWLDSNNIDWDVECTCYVITDKESYRPDFFIYDNHVLVNIVEVKGYYKNRLWKVEELKKMMKKEGVLVTIIDNIKPYIINNTYQNELKCWKINRLLGLK